MNEVYLMQRQGRTQKLRKIIPAANDVFGFDATGKLDAFSPEDITGEVTLTGAQDVEDKTLVAPILSEGVTAAGSASNDFSSSTGAFLTSSGANTLSGDVSVAADKDIVFAAGDGALDASLGTGAFKSTSGANTLSGDVSVAAGKDVVYAAGDGAFDASLGTGVTKTTSGLNTISGFAAMKTIVTPVAAAGTDVTDAAQLGAANQVYVSSDGATKGVKLGTGVAGQVVDIINTSATACELYAVAAGTVNGLAADASVVIPASKGVRCFCTTATAWKVYDMTALAAAS